jgi:virginiamycin A acetyltransferase
MLHIGTIPVPKPARPAVRYGEGYKVGEVWLSAHADGLPPIWTADNLLRGVCRLLLVPVIALCRLESVVLGSERAFCGHSQGLSLIPGVLGDYLRREFYRLMLEGCAPDCQISFGTIFSTRDVVIGAGAYIGEYCMIGRCRIGRDALIGSRVSIISGLHQHGIADLHVPIKHQAGNRQLIHLGEDCFIGEGAIVAADIGDHAVVSTGAVVFRPVAPLAIVRGNPAELVRMRNAP